LQSAGTTAITVDTSQNVGIGTASPNKKLEVVSAGEIIRATSTTGANDQNISIKNNSGTADTSTNIFFADRYAATSYASSYIRGTSSGTSALIFATGGTNFTNIYDAGAPTEKARVNTFGIGLGGTTPTSGMGIAFPATQSASTDANTLDDYEEGDWTPTYTASSGSFGAITYRFQQGKYTKIGRAVSFTCLIATDSITVSTATGSVNISGLPFTNNAAENGYAVSSANTFGANYPSGANTAASGTTIRLLYRTAANGTTANFPVTSLDTTSAYGNLVQIGGTYFV
jgi:hypothetical protein